MTQPVAPPAAGRPAWPWSPDALARRWPFVTFFLLAVLSNAFGSVFNIVYNHHLIVKAYLNESQQNAWPFVVLAYNLVAYTFGLGVLLAVLRPLSGCLCCARAGRRIKPARLERCRRLLVNLPAIQVGVNFLCWALGAIVFPLALCCVGGWGNAEPIWRHFFVSFLMAALLTTVQTFFLLEWFLMQVVYGDFFRDERPADVRGAWRISLRWRLVLYWTATAVVPLLALLAVALNFTEERRGDFGLLRHLSLGVAIVSVGSSALIAWLVGSQLVGWVSAHTAATERVTEGNYAVRIAERRPDELGRLTDRFNDMCSSLERAQVEREVFGEVVGPDARDEMLDYRGLGGEVREVTVLFADIRGFTRRSAGETPEQAVELLNRFFTHAVAAVQGQNGHVNKFLGDGVLALFGAPRKQADHAERAVTAALDLLGRLERLNQDLVEGGVVPLRVGIGIHTGPALVGSIGAALGGSDGKKRFRREYTAIGETVNLGQRLEQLTKTCGGPVLVSEQTRDRLNGGIPLTCLGPQGVPGYEGTLVVYRVEAQGFAPPLAD